MRYTSRLLPGCAAVACILGASLAAAAPFTVATSPPAPGDSVLNIDLATPTPNDVLDTAGPIFVSGDVDASVSVSSSPGTPWTSGTGNGTLTFNGASLALSDLDQTLSLGALGGLDIHLDGVGMTLSSSAIPVQNNEWNLDSIGAPTTLDISLNTGTITLDNPTGLIALFLTSPVVLDLDAEPLGVGIADLLGLNIGGTADDNSIGLNIPAIPIEALNDPVTVYAVLRGDVYLQVVPEPGSIAMLGMGLIGLVAMGRRRFRKV